MGDPKRVTGSGFKFARAMIVLSGLVGFIAIAALWVF